jgi:phosphoribosylglycinamide formyltransferase-1
MINISVMVSGGGTNLQALIDGIEDGRIEGAEIALVLSSRDGAFALERAGKAGIKTIVISKEEYPDESKKAEAILSALSEAKTDLVVTAGYMSILDKSVCLAYKGRMINIHPALLPKYGGKGYYGLNVHKAVLEAGEKETGATVHYVDDEGIDSGEIILQESLPVLDGDTPDTLQKRVLEKIEHRIIVRGTNIVIQRLLLEKTDELSGASGQISGRKAAKQ